MTQAITFLRGWQGRPAGSTDTRLAPGVMATLVSFGTARWADTQEQPTQTRLETVTRGRKRR